MANIIFFGSLGDQVDQAELTFDLSETTKTAQEIFDAICTKNPRLTNARESIPIKVALNQKIADWDASVSDNDELAFLPPVTGG